MSLDGTYGRSMNVFEERSDRERMARVAAASEPRSGNDRMVSPRIAANRRSMSGFLFRGSFGYSTLRHGYFVGGASPIFANPAALDHDLHARGPGVQEHPGTRPVAASSLTPPVRSK